MKDFPYVTNTSKFPTEIFPVFSNTIIKEISTSDRAKILLSVIHSTLGTVFGIPIPSIASNDTGTYLINEGSPIVPEFLSGEFCFELKYYKWKIKLSSLEATVLESTLGGQKNKVSFNLQRLLHPLESIYNPQNYTPKIHEKLLDVILLIATLRLLTGKKLSKKFVSNILITPQDVPSILVLKSNKKDNTLGKLIMYSIREKHIEKIELV